MNTPAILDLLLGVLLICSALPLIKRKVKMNGWYGVRIAAAYASDEAWYDINHYGGRLLLRFGIVLAASSVVGLFVPKEFWSAYRWTWLGILAVGILVLIARIHRYAARRPGAP